MNTEQVNEKLTRWREANPLAKARKKHKLTVANCAAVLGCSLGSIQKWENGSQIPSLDWRKTMRDEMGISLKGWLDWIAAKPKLTLK